MRSSSSAPRLVLLIAWELVDSRLPIALRASSAAPWYEFPSVLAVRPNSAVALLYLRGGNRKRVRGFRDRRLHELLSQTLVDRSRRWLPG